jgi:CTP synthase
LPGLCTEILPSSQVNPDMVPEFENAGLQFVGKDDTGRRMEV